MRAGVMTADESLSKKIIARIPLEKEVFPIIYGKLIHYL
jgi:hypothetical protein